LLEAGGGVGVEAAVGAGVVGDFEVRESVL